MRTKNNSKNLRTKTQFYNPQNLRAKKLTKKIIKKCKKTQKSQKVPTFCAANQKS